MESKDLRVEFIEPRILKEGENTLSGAQFEFFFHIHDPIAGVYFNNEIKSIIKKESQRIWRVLV